MSAIPSPKSIGRRAWIAVRFVLFGCIGFYVMLFCWFAFIARVFDHDQHIISPFLSLPLVFIGALMVLYGVGEWGRWAYLWVFLSIPISLFLLQLILSASGASPVILAAVAAVAAFTTNFGVRTYYARRVPDKRDKDDHAA
jgi:hypothetical protein